MWDSPRYALTIPSFPSARVTCGHHHAWIAVGLVYKFFSISVTNGETEKLSQSTYLVIGMECKIVLFDAKALELK